MGPLGTAVKPEFSPAGDQRPGLFAALLSPCQEGQNTVLVTGQRQAPWWLCLVSGSGSRVGLSRLLGQDSGCGSGHHLPLEPAGFPSPVPSLPTAQ